MSTHTLFITEVFASLQGEGPLMGQPATFVRLSGCIKPYCHFCDTTFSFAKGEEIEVNDLAKQVLALNQNLVVITGGEPFLQQGEALDLFETILLEAGVNIQYETSGRIEITTRRAGITVVCSPKQVGLFDSDEWSFVPSNIGRVDCFKFVYSDNEKQLCDFIANYEIPSEKVYVMPEGSSLKKQLAKMEDAWNLCVKQNWNFCPRLHVLAFDEKTGV